MDAAYDVGREIPPGQGEKLQTAESLRDEIEATSRILHEHIDELRERLQHRIDSLRNPLGLHDRVVQHPFTACGIALVAGATVGFLRSAEGAPREVARRFGARVGDTIAGQVASRFFDRMVGLGL
jgi:hypothetical protein